MRILLSAILALIASLPAFSAPLRFEVTMAKSLNAPKAGRLFVVVSPTNQPEPRLMLGRVGVQAPPVWARDLTTFNPESVEILEHKDQIFHPNKTPELAPGTYFVQALFDCQTDLRSTQAQGNLYSLPQSVTVSTSSATVRIELTQAIPAEQTPPDTAQIKFVKIQSRLLSDFHHRPIFLRAGVLLPKDYDLNSTNRYPLWVRIGGLNARYTAVSGMMGEKSDFRKTWLADSTPRFILLQLDGAGPFGDPYQVNSENNGPYGDAITQELIPYIESHFRAIAQPHARVLSGASTGGWACLALQIFYPDFFNGAWAACPDPVDFRAFQLVDIYGDKNAFVNAHGYERPSRRNQLGDVTMTLRDELLMENVLGRGNSFVCSGGDFGAWNAIYSPRSADGCPLPIWNPQTGNIDPVVAEHWKKYDLRLILEQNAQTLAPKLRSKIHIAAGEADQYFLNSAVHLLDQSLAKVKPSFAETIVYGPGKPHGWSNLSMSEMLQEMSKATQATKND